MKKCFAFQDFAPRVIVMYVIALLAFLFYISKVPERYFPGKQHYYSDLVIYSKYMVEVYASEYQKLDFLQYYWS